MSFRDRIEFWCISFMHDTMYGLFVNPETLLLPAGLKADQHVLEVGCGPGFFTIPAAEIVGQDGVVYAIDVNPFAIKKVEKKMAKKKVTNIKPILTDVKETGLPDNSIDLAFFFGVIHSLIESLDKTLLEMDRILKKDGIISIQKSWKNEENIVNLVEESGKFVLIENSKRIMKFCKK
ncbi:MAG: methyltransferase domain-containing protein [Candidatus Heimdallarchaeota archaeon]|nr:methyltransferase domain-containing protein [Candidatus Heimdallarchaeota archaeon]